MRVISKRALSEFWSVHRDAEGPLRAWYSVCKKTDFENFSHVKRSLPGVDKVEKFTVFNVAGNKYRLIVVIHYDRRKIFIRHVLTHKEYDLGHWKRE